MFDYLIRKANIYDAEQIAEISTDDLGYECGADFVRANITELLQLSTDVIFVAESGGNVVGFIHAVIYKTIYMPTLVNVMGLAVSSKFRGHGLGKSLLLEVEKWCFDIGAVGVRVNSSIKRTEAHKFYRAMGYTSEKEQKRFIKYVK